MNFLYSMYFSSKENQLSNFNFFFLLFLFLFKENTFFLTSSADTAQWRQISFKAKKWGFYKTSLKRLLWKATFLQVFFVTKRHLKEHCNELLRVLNWASKRWLKTLLFQSSPLGIHSSWILFLPEPGFSWYKIY